MSSREALKRLRRHRVPAWWSDAKLGIFIHWTPASVPGWAPVDSHIGELLVAGRPDALAHNPYTEWYENSLRFPDSPVSRHHRETYGNKPYEEFAAEYQEGLASWDPDEWARTFASTGARYVVLVSKHHDGWCLWPSSVANPNRSGWHSERDIVGELREAVLGVGMRFGLYYSGGLDWTFEPRPIGNLGDMLAAVPRGNYPAYADAQLRELIDRYRPSVLWNDIAWPTPGGQLWPTLEYYYRKVPDGVINDRWMPWSPIIGATQWEPARRAANSLNARTTRSGGGLIPPKPPHFDVRTPEYVVFDDVQRHPWECVRGMDQSFGYNRNSGPEHFLDPDDLLDTAADIVAKGGNLLLNVGPRGEDATIPPEQLALLGALGDWSAGEGTSIFGSRPWVRPAGHSAEGHDLRYWAKDRSVFASLQSGDADGGTGGPGGSPDASRTGDPSATDPSGTGDPRAATENSVVTLADLRATPTTSARSTAGVELAHEQAPTGLRVHLDNPANDPDATHRAIELRDVEAT
ncbi:MAG: alpha-L-fucosidase [Microthrixaceae bacterium]